MRHFELLSQNCLLHQKVAQEGQMGANLLVEGHRGGQLQGKTVKGDDAQLVNHKHDLEILDQVDLRC